VAPIGEYRDMPKTGTASGTAIKITINRQPPSTIINNHQQSTIINNHQQSSTIINKH
jgi:hypothetical protein